MVTYTSPTGLTWHNTIACTVLRNLGGAARGGRGLVPCEHCVGPSELPHEQRLAQADTRVAEARANPQMPWSEFADVLFTTMRAINTSGHRINNRFHHGPVPTSGPPSLHNIMQTVERLLADTHPNRLTTNHHQQVQHTIAELVDTQVKATPAGLAAHDSSLWSQGLWVQYFDSPARLLHAGWRHKSGTFAAANRDVDPNDVLAACLLGVQSHTDASHDLRTFAAVPRPAAALLQWAARSRGGLGSPVQLVGPVPDDTDDLRMLLQTCTQVHANADHTGDNLPDILTAAAAALT